MIHFASSPLRVSLIGGGTDFESFYKNYNGAVINFTIDKYVYVLVKNKFDKNIKLSYSINEYPKSINEIKHSLIKNIFKLYNIKNNIELISIADIHSKGTGLGSSSAFTIASLTAINSFLKMKPLNRQKLAELACNIEIKKNKSPIGVQDQYSSCFGGFNFMEFSKKGVYVKRYDLQKNELNHIHKNLYLYNTGIKRSNNSILQIHKKNIKQNLNIDYLKHLRDQTYILNDQIKLKNFDYIPIAINKSWELKQKFNKKTNNQLIEKLINKGINSGATAAKLLGAGGGGFILFHVKNKNKDNFMNNMGKKNFLEFKFENNGVKSMYLP